jgi:hypothetical protein
MILVLKPHSGFELVEWVLLSKIIAALLKKMLNLLLTAIGSDIIARFCFND